MKKWKRMIAVMVSMALTITSMPWTSHDSVVKAAATASEEHDGENNNLYKADMVNRNLMRNDYLGMYTGDDGGFSFGTTGGNPDNPWDNDQSLLYGYASGSTSDTTFQINGNSYTY